MDLSELVITKGMSKKYDSAVDEDGNLKQAPRNIIMSDADKAMKDA
jgi:hypothetical protein